MNLHDYISSQIKWSQETFGPHGYKGVVDHIRKELIEIENNPNDLEEWIDVIILALDGAWRQGHSIHSIIQMLDYKQQKNFNRKWPDWRTVPADKAIEHIRTNDITGKGGSCGI